MYQAISVKSFIKVQTIKENLPKSLHGSDFRKILKQDKKFRGLYLFMEAVELLFMKWVDRWTKQGYAAIAMDTVGCRPLKDWEASPPVRIQLKNGGPVSANFKLDVLSPENAWTRQAVEAIKAAHSILLSLPEVNKDKTGILGISWGGYLVCFAAAEDHRFKAAASVYGCGFLKATPTVVLASDAWLKLFDPATVIANISCPFLFITRPDDGAYPWKSWKKSTKLLSEAYLSVPGKFGHGHGCALRQENIVFFDTMLKNGSPLPKITSIKKKKNHISAKIISKEPIIKGELWYTTDPDAIKDAQKKWLKIPLKMHKNSLSVELLPDTKDWFLNICDKRGYTATALKK